MNTNFVFILIIMLALSQSALYSQASFTQTIENPDGISFTRFQLAILPEFHDVNNDGAPEFFCTARGNEFGNYDQIGFFKNIGTSVDPEFDSLHIANTPMFSDEFVSPLTFGDLNGDGTIDAIKCVPNVENEMWDFLFLENGSDSTLSFVDFDVNPFGLDLFSSNYPFLFPRLIDFDGDQDLDLMLVEFSGDIITPYENDVYYLENIGDRFEPSFEFHSSIVSEENGIPLILLPGYADFDNDSDYDMLGIVLLDEVSAVFTYIENKGTSESPEFGMAMNMPFQLTDTFSAEDIIGSDILDYDLDGDLDLFILYSGESSSNTRLYLNETVSKKDIFLPEDAGIQVYPNPVSDVITVKTELPQNAHLLLFDSQGKQQLHKMMRQQNQMQIDVSQLPAGTYYLHYEDEKIKTAQKIIIQ